MIISSRLRPLRSSELETRLDFLPQELTIFEIIQAILVFIGRQILALLHLGNNFQRTTSQNGEVFRVPKLGLSMKFGLKPSNLRDYAAAVRLANAESIFDDPRQLCLMLSAFCEPASLLLLAHHRSPIRPLGSVNTGNIFELSHPDLCSPELLCRDNVFEIRARMVPETRKRKRGLEMDIEVDLVHLKDDRVVFRQIFTMLQFMKFRSAPTEFKSIPTQDGNLPTNSIVEISIGEKDPLKWARICKDYNPIHISNTLAKAFGFRSILVHGNHALALAVGALEQCGNHERLKSNEKFTFGVQFRRPISLPAVMQIDADAGGQQVRLHNHGKEYLTTG